VIEVETPEGPAILSLSPTAAAVLAEELQEYLKIHQLGFSATYAIGSGSDLFQTQLIGRFA
jgi:hypothetical protein